MGMAELEKLLKKRIKGVTLKTANDPDLADTGELIDVIPTGSIILDNYVLGNGGLPVPRISVFSGVFSSGKSTFSQNAIVNAQKKGYTTFLIELEKSFDRKRLEHIGVDIEKLHIIHTDVDDQQFTVETLFEVIEGILKAMEEKVFIVVDSLGVLQNIAEAESSMMQNAAMASTPRAIKRGMKKINALLPERKSAVLFITPVYANISGYGDKFIEYGGSGVNYYASTMTRFSIKKKEKEELFQVVLAKNIKIKVSTPFREGLVYLGYDGKIMDSYSVLDVAYKHSIVKRKGSWYEYNGNTFQKKTLASQPFYNELREEVAKLLQEEIKQYREEL